MTQHQPKGSMCQTCCGGSLACATLPFASMPVIKAYPDGAEAVKCRAHRLARLHSLGAARAAVRWLKHN